jgi:hypothetical protein
VPVPLDVGQDVQLVVAGAGDRHHGAGVESACQERRQCRAEALDPVDGGQLPDQSQQQVAAAAGDHVGGHLLDGHPHALEPSPGVPDREVARPPVPLRAGAGLALGHHAVGHRGAGADHLAEDGLVGGGQGPVEVGRPPAEVLVRGDPGHGGQGTVHPHEPELGVEEGDADR